MTDKGFDTPGFATRDGDAALDIHMFNELTGLIEHGV